MTLHESHSIFIFLETVITHSQYHSSLLAGVRVRVSRNVLEKSVPDGNLEQNNNIIINK